MAIGDPLNPDCTVRTCRVPLLFMSILAHRLHPVVVASMDCMSSISEATPTIDEHGTNMDGYATNLLEHLPNLNETGIAPDEHVTSLMSRWSSISEHAITCAASVITAVITEPVRKSSLQNTRASRASRTSHCYHAVPLVNEFDWDANVLADFVTS